MPTIKEFLTRWLIAFLTILNAIFNGYPLRYLIADAMKEQGG